MKKYLFFLLISNFINAQWSITNAERNALVNIYNSTNGNNWNRTWDLEKDPRNWFGVVVKSGSVTELNLSGNALTGNFPAYITTFTKLTKLDISNNNLSGEVSTLSSLAALSKLDICNNRLTGDPTNSVSGLINLTDLALGGNTFTITDTNALLQNFNNIKSLNLADLGLVTIPSRIASFTNLESLILDNNPIAANAYTNLSTATKLKTLSIAGTQLVQIPTQVSQRTQLTSLNLSNNNITEHSTQELSTLTNLEWLSLENNQLTQVPSQLSQLKKLQNLNLGRNKINGGLATLSSLPNLQQLFLNNNQISGSFPASLLSIKKLLMLNLNSNQLTGDIPDKLPKITQISNNKYTRASLSNYISDNTEQTELNYSPQRYDTEKEVLGVIGQQAKLDQSLSGDYQFTWYKNLDNKINNTSENLSFSSVANSDFAIYTAEAYSYKTLNNNILFDLSLFREPISLVDSLATLGTSDLKDISIYPNPATDYINILNIKTKIKNVTIFDLSGKQMLSDNKEKINVSKLPSGVYLIFVKTESGIKTFKFIKQ